MLYIKITNPKEDVRPVDSGIFEMSDGSTLILDIGKDGVLYGMEMLISIRTGLAALRLPHRPTAAFIGLVVLPRALASIDKGSNMPYKLESCIAESVSY